MSMLPHLFPVLMLSFNTYMGIHSDEKDMHSLEKPFILHFAKAHKKKKCCTIIDIVI